MEPVETGLRWIHERQLHSFGTCHPGSKKTISQQQKVHSRKIFGKRERTCNIFSGENILRTRRKVEQSGSRFTALFFWERIYLWQYLSISCAFAIYGSYITAKMGLLVPPADFYHVKEKNYYRKLPLVLCSILPRHKLQINHCCKLYWWENYWLRSSFKNTEIIY